MIITGNRFDSLHINRIDLQGFVECERCHDRELVRCIHAAYVEGWISLGVAKALSLSEHCVKGAVLALLGHLGQDEVSGAIDNSGNALHSVAHKALIQCFDNRNAATHRRLE